MLRRLAIALPLTVAALILIDRGSLLVSRCNSVPREGIIIAAIEWLANLPPEAWTALATTAIAAFTATLWWSTRGMLGATNQSIKLSIDEFRATHRPKIRIKHFWLARDIWNGQSVVVNVTCVNTGTAEAILSEIGLRCVVATANSPIPIDPNIAAIRNLGGARLPSGLNWETKDIDTKMVLTAQDKADIQQGSSKFYCVGFVSYLDAASRMRITGFCRVLTFPPDGWTHIGNCRFRRARDSDYEYED
jgi:hypothetical protein